MTVVIIGAGITGLTAAYELTRRGLGVRVLEAASRAGGLIQTEHTAGFTIEAGPDSVLRSKPAALSLIRDLGLENDLQSVRPPGGAYVLRGHTLYALPRPSVLGIPTTWSGLARYSLFPPAARARIALEPIVPARRETGDEPVGAFFRRRFGAAAVDLIAQPLLGGIHAGDIEQLSMLSLFPRLIEVERTRGSILRGWPDAAPSVSPFASLRGGMATLVGAIERQLPPATIRYGARTLSLERAPTGWRAVQHSPAVAAPPESGGTEDAAAVLIAAPAYVASSLLAAIDAEAARLCGQVPYVSTASVALAWPRALIAHPLNGTGFVVARRHSDVRITACTWVSSKWAARAPEQAVLLRAFVGGAHDPEAVSLSDDDLIALVRRDLRAVMGIDAEPSLARVFRWRDAGAQHVVGHLDRVAAIDRRLAGSGIFVAGSGFRAVGIPDCIADARRVSADIAAFLDRSQ